MSKNMWMNEAREYAAQCWCDPETSDRVVDPILAEAVAKRIAAWMDTAAQYARNVDYYQGLLDQIATVFGQEAYINDDGTIQDSPLRAKMPELVKQQQAEIEWLRSLLETAVDAWECGIEVFDGVKLIDYKGTMRVLCPTCSGKGSISDPKCMNLTMGYSGPNGEIISQVICQSCYGSSWVEQLIQGMRGNDRKSMSDH